MPKRFSSSLSNLFAGLATSGNSMIARANQELIAREAAEAQLEAILATADHAVIAHWINRRYDSKTHLAKMLRGNAYIIAVELAKHGVPAEHVTLYALQQVIELCTGHETNAASVEATARAYCAIHTAGAGPATGGIARAVRLAFDYGR
ncbi:hypothetical protein [Kribbella sp. CA-293567]|uniref:hypothetical protein n=1 Tax=Kribbella sp. CA-293567 TaxID=3002436 RepID=UPI0022DE56F7|nr:hypothetical protein [Kribbella sp. CA-293567]WBQ03006.1 hypothetical protein OX958_23850 [Kribbella sp. CA-293567]